MPLKCLKKAEGCPGPDHQKRTGCGHNLYAKFKEVAWSEKESRFQSTPFRLCTFLTNYAAAEKWERDERARIVRETDERRRHPERAKERPATVIPTLAQFARPPKEDSDRGGEWWWRYASVEYAEHPKTLEFNRHRIQALLRFEKFAQAPLDQIDNKLMHEYVSERRGRFANCTINHDMKVLKKLLGWGYDWDYIPKLPKMPKLLEEEEAGREILKAEEDVYFDALDRRIADSGLRAAGFVDLRILVMLGIDTSCEPGQVVLNRLDWSHIHLSPVGKWKYGSLHIPHTKRKARARDVPITTPRLHWALMKRWISRGRPAAGLVFPSPAAGYGGRARDYSSLSQLHERLWEGEDALTIPYFRPYDVRHTFITRMFEAGADITTIESFVGWVNPKMLANYAHRNQNRKAMGAEQFRGYLEEIGIIEENVA